MDVIQIGILGVAGALLAVQFKSGKTEYGIYISLALSLFIFFAVVSRLKILVDLLAQIGPTYRWMLLTPARFLKCWASPMWRSFLPRSVKTLAIRRLPCRSRFLQNWPSWC